MSHKIATLTGALARPGANVERAAWTGTVPAVP
ncbi:hypothetical protein QF031_003840 [Pseudarthrobacter defluvii]|nr:hypothetical protein [Pseudarthrobacter defluvii]